MTYAHVHYINALPVFHIWILLDNENRLLLLLSCVASVCICYTGITFHGVTLRNLSDVGGWRESKLHLQL